MSDRTQEITNLRKVSTACKSYTDQKIDDLKWELGSHTLNVESDTTIAYTKTVPVGTIGCTLDKIGGMSYKSINLVNESTLTFNQNTYNGTNSYYRAFTGFYIYLQSGTYTISSSAFDSGYSISVLGTSSQTQFSNNVLFDSEYHSSSFTFTISQNLYCSLYFKKVVNNADQIFTASDLSQYYYMLNKGSTALPYQPYFEGIRDSAVTSVVSKDSNATTLDTFTIPAEVQALTGYGWGVNENIYNYIDLILKKYFYNAVKYNLKNINKSSFSVQTSGITSGYNYRFNVTGFKVNDMYSSTSITYNNTKTLNCGESSYDVTNEIGFTFHLTGHYLILYTKTLATIGALYDYLQANDTIIIFKQQTPVETDISEYIEDNIIEVEAGGTLTFTNTYEQAVPSEVDYLIEEVKA